MASELGLQVVSIIMSPKLIQLNFNGLNTFGTMKISSRQGEFEQMRVDFVKWHNRNYFLDFPEHEGTLCVLIRGDSNEYTQHAIINIKKKIKLNYPKYNNVCSYGIFP